MMNLFNFPITRRTALASIGASAFASSAFAQADRRVRLIVPTSAGGATDATARLLQPGLSAALGVPVTVENVAGAAGVVGLQTMARAGAGELAMVVITNSIAILPSTMKSFPFDISKDFTPVAMLASIPMSMAASAKLPATNAKDLIAIMKKQPDELTFGSSGTGSISHLATEMFLDEAGVKARHIPYQGPNPMTTALLGSQIDFASQGLPVFHPYFKSGTLRPIGVLSGKRSSAALDIPTMAEQGLPNLQIDAWVTLLGPKNMELALVRKVHAAAVQAFSTEAVKDQLARQGSQVTLAGPDEARAVIARDTARFAAVVKKLGLEPQ